MDTEYDPLQTTIDHVAQFKRVINKRNNWRKVSRLARLFMDPS